MQHRTPRLLVLLASAALAAVSAAAAQGTRWVAPGNADGSGAVAAPAVREAPEPAWSQRFGGTLEGEPLVWDERVLVVTHERDGRRLLSLLDLASGRRLAQQALVTATPLTPSVFGDRVAVRTSRDRVELLRASGTRFQALRAFQGRAPVSPPLLVQDALFLRVGDELHAYLLDRNAPAWRATGAGAFRGRPSFSEGVLFAVRYLDRGIAALCLFDARDGTLLQAVACGDHGGAVPSVDAELRIAVLADEVFVHFPLPVPVAGGEHRMARVALERTPAGPRLLADGNVDLFPHAHLPAATPHGWLALETDGAEPSRWIARSNAGHDAHPDRGRVLADAGAHADLLDAPAPAAVGGSVAVLGDVAADVVTWEVLWRLPAASLVRPVPCEPAPGVGGWLVAPASDRLALLRGPDPARDPVRARALARVRILAQREADALAQLAQRAVACGDTALVARLIRAAVQRGVSPDGAPARALALAQDGLARLHAAEGRRIDPRASETHAAEAERILDRLPDELAREAAGSNDPAFQRALLRALLEREPDHPGAADAVHALLPTDAVVAPDVPFDATSWLDFLDTTARWPVSVERPGATPGIDPVGERLAREAADWRPDLVAYRSARLAVITPPDRPGAVARALAVGELVCDVLEEVFGHRTARVDAPLVLLLYTSSEEYRTQSQRDRSVPEVARGWTVGHYDARDDLSRLYVPPGDEGVERMLSTFAHELAHHWVATRSPFADAARRAGGRRERPGFWLVEGFANLVGELALDPEAGTWSADDPRAESLDAVAGAPPDALLDWGTLLDSTKATFDALPLGADHTVPLTWRLGGATRRSALNFFYDQAGALAHHLFTSQDGRHRGLLLEALRAYYVGDPPVDVPGRLGLRSAALGEAVVAHARERIGR